MTSEKERKNREKLFELLRENPDLPVLAMVESEIVADDGYARWAGSFGDCYVGEYINGEERIYFRDDEDDEEMERLVEEMLGPENCETITPEIIKETYQNAGWIKAIIVDIDLPE